MQLYTNNREGDMQKKLVLCQENIYRSLHLDFSARQSAERDGNLNKSCRARAQSATGKDGSKNCEYFLDRALGKICLWIVTVFSSLNAQELITTEKTITFKESPQLQELVFLISPQDLHLDQGDISVKINGHSYPIYSLKRSGNQWMAKVIITRVNYCPQGHLTCEGCGQCHTGGCRYYVQPCKLW